MKLKPLLKKPTPPNKPHIRILSQYIQLRIPVHYLEDSNLLYKLRDRRFVNVTVAAEVEDGKEIPVVVVVTSNNVKDSTLEKYGLLEAQFYDGTMIQKGNYMVIKCTRKAVRTKIAEALGVGLPQKRKAIVVSCNTVFLENGDIILTKLTGKPKEENVRG